MRFASLGSGSAGNALLVEDRTTCLMVDCGFAVRETVARLARLGIVPEDVGGIVVTHEHGDHIAGVFPFARRYGVPVWLTHGTLAATLPGRADGVDCRIIDSHADFAVGCLRVCPFPVPHDAREPVQFVIRGGAGDLGVLTDIGDLTPHVVAMLGAVDALVLECNHDREMLSQSRYPAALKRRIAGRFGHLANDRAAKLVAAIDHARLQHLVAAHLSLENNQPARARAALEAVLVRELDRLSVATQETGFGWLEIR